jgi:hypothetical protein
MKAPTITQAHAICDSVRARAVIVIALYEDTTCGASYGETKLLCKQAGFTLDCIMAALEDGSIPVWATKESEDLRLRQISKDRLQQTIREDAEERP